MNMTQNRRILLKGIAGAAATAMAPSMAFAQAGGKFNMKIAITLPESHPTPVALKAACAEIQKETNGRLNIDVYTSGQLGSDTDTLSQVRSGAIDFVCTAGSIYGNLVPAASINSIAFAFPDYATVWKAMEGDLGAYMRASFDKVNLVQVGKVFDHGFRQITHSSKPITTPKDLVGMKIRVPATPLWTSVFKGLDASPASVPIGELYTALQTKVLMVKKMHCLRLMLSSCMKFRNSARTHRTCGSTSLWLVTSESGMLYRKICVLLLPKFWMPMR